MSIFETKHLSAPFSDEYLVGEVEGKSKIFNKNDVKKIERDLATYSDEIKSIVHYRFNYIQ